VPVPDTQLLAAKNRAIFMSHPVHCIIFEATLRVTFHSTSLTAFSARCYRYLGQYCHKVSVCLSLSIFVSCYSGDSPTGCWSIILVLYTSAPSVVVNIGHKRTLRFQNLRLLETLGAKIGSHLTLCCIRRMNRANSRFTLSLMTAS